MPENQTILQSGPCGTGRRSADGGIGRIASGPADLSQEPAAGLPVRFGTGPDWRGDFAIGIQMQGISLPVIRQR